MANSALQTATGQSNEQDSSIVRASKDLGLYIGGVYSLVNLQSDAYFIGDKTGKPELKNSPGMVAGFCYNFYAGKHSIVRPAIEAVFMPVAIEYQTAVNYKLQQRVLPLTVELPFSWIYSAYRTKAFPRPTAKPEFGLSLRPVIAVKPLVELQPVVKTMNLNTDVFVGYPVGNNKSVMRMELFYSHGWFNLIEEGTDYRTANISKLMRHAAGIRLIFH
ncbi:MAG: hypothetical protein ACK5BL_03205 [Flavobacteriales bacterium]